MLNNWQDNILNHRLIEIITKKKIIIFFTLSLSTIFLFLRAPDAIINPQFWAEDGVIFFRESLLYGYKSFLIPYAGYLLTIPRMLAYIGSFLPYSMVPAYYNGAAFFILLFVSAQFFSNRIDLPYKSLFALSLVWIPNYGEVYTNLTNAETITALLLVLLFLKTEPRNKNDSIFDYFTLLLVGLTGPYIIFSLPLFLIKYLKTHLKHDLNIFLVGILLAFIQACYIFIYHAPTLQHQALEIFPLVDWIKDIGIRFFGELFLNSHGSAYSILLATASFSLVPLLYFLGSNKKRNIYLISSFLLFAALLTLAAFWRVKNASLLSHSGACDRYFFIPRLMIMWCLILGMEASGLKKVIAAILFGWMVLVALPHFERPPYTDLHWQEYASKIGKQAVSIPINPGGAAWVINIPKLR